MVAMARPESRSFIGKLARWRALVQTGFLFAWLGPPALQLHNVCGPVFHCYACPLSTFACPIGIVATFCSLGVFPFMALGTLLLFGGIVGSIVCGWLCPFGFLQDLIGRIPTPKLRIPAWSGYFRFAVLVGLVLFVPLFLGKSHPLFICSVCPAGALEGAGPFMVKAALAGNPVVWPNVLKVTITVLVVTAMFFTWRPWCRLFCPLGAIYGLLNKLSFVSLAVDPGQCTHCGLCRRDCRYGIDPAVTPNSTQCTRCFDCTRCGAISVRFPFAGRCEMRADPPDNTSGIDSAEPE
jgi:ferredoxin-type protein NapH